MTTVPTAHLDNKHVVFGRVLKVCIKGRARRWNAWMGMARWGTGRTEDGVHVASTQMKGNVIMLGIATMRVSTGGAGLTVK